MTGNSTVVQSHSRAPTEQSGGSAQGRLEQCPECGEALTRADGETFCGGCGAVVEDQPVQRDVAAVTSRDDGVEDQAVRPTTSARHDKGLGSTMGRPDRDARGETLTGRRRKQMARLQTRARQGQARTRQERTLRSAMSEIKRITGALGLPWAVREGAGRLARAAGDEGLYEGRSVDALAAAAVYAACREHDLTRSMRTVARAAGVPVDGTDEQAGLKRHYRVLTVHLGLETALVTATDWVPRLAASAEVAELVRRRAMRFAAVVEDNAIEFGGTAPSTLAATCLVVAAGNRVRSQASLVEDLPVSESAVRAAKPAVIGVLEEASLEKTARAAVQNAR